MSLHFFLWKTQLFYLTFNLKCIGCFCFKRCLVLLIVPYRNSLTPWFLSLFCYKHKLRRNFMDFYRETQSRPWSGNKCMVLRFCAHNNLKSVACTYIQPPPPLYRACKSPGVCRFQVNNSADWNFYLFFFTQLINPCQIRWRATVNINFQVLQSRYIHWLGHSYQFALT